jgi:hypothetical protein
MTFLNAVLLFGLAAVVIPPIVHLFNRRKYDVVDWAAMQFLQLSQKTKRRVFLEQFWLMLLRMVLVTLVCLALAAPQVTSRFLGTASAGGPRDVVLLIDGSASMGYRHKGTTAADAARDWAAAYLDRLRPGDRVAVFQVKTQPVPIVPALTADRDQARNALELLTPPKGTADWPAAVQSALALLDDGNPSRDVIVISDDQRFGWADETAAAKWELVRRGADRAGTPNARIWVANVAGDRPANPPNWSVEPITTARGVAAAGREIAFRSAVRYSGEPGAKPAGPVKLTVDGTAAGEVKADGDGDPRTLTFARKFGTGSHLVTLQLDDDELPGDNRQDFAVEVLPVVPVLLVSGGRGGDFLRDALAPVKDPTPAFAVRSVGIAEWSTTLFLQDVKGPGTAPRVLVLANIEKLTPAQQQDVEKFLAAGGSVLVTVGDRCDAAAWNRVAFRAGQGFLPARLVEPVGDEADVPNAAKVLPASFTHPALEVFKEPLPGGLHTAYFPRRWKLDPSAGANGDTGTAVGLFTTREPFLVERAFGKGRVILAAHPLDNSWRTNLIRLPDFVRLAHELLYYLAGTRTAERNLLPGQPIVYTPRPDEPPGAVTVVGPTGRARTVAVESWPAMFDGTTDPGAYKLTTPSGRTVYFAVRNDSREAMLTPCGDDDRQRVADAVGGLSYVANADEITERGGGEPVPTEVWWVLFLLVLGLLTAEVWYTRRLTDRGEHNLGKG